MSRLPRMDTDKSWYTIGEAARLLGVSVDTLRRWEAKGDISATRTPGGDRRFAAAEVGRLYSQKVAS